MRCQEVVGPRLELGFPAPRGARSSLRCPCLLRPLPFLLLGWGSLPSVILILPPGCSTQFPLFAAVCSDRLRRAGVRPPPPHLRAFAFLLEPQASEPRVGEMAQEGGRWLCQGQREQELVCKKEGRPAVLFLPSSAAAFPVRTEGGSWWVCMCSPGGLCGSHSRDLHSCRETRRRVASLQLKCMSSPVLPEELLLLLFLEKSGHSGAS